MIRIMISILSVFLFSTMAHAATSREIVATCIILEAGGEGEAGMHAVMNVIRNRARAQEVDSYRKVVLKRHQFSCMVGDIDKLVEKAKKHAKWNDALRLVDAKDLIDLTGGSKHYHVWRGRMKVSPAWTHPDLGGKNKNARIQVYIGDHVFLTNVD